MRKLLFTIIYLLIFTACKKSETEPPKVSISFPSATDSFYLADSIGINFTVTDENLKFYKIIISNFYTHKIFYKEETSSADKTITITKKIFIDVAADTIAYLNVLGIDKNGNTGGAGISFKLKK